MSMAAFNYRQCRGPARHPFGTISAPLAGGDRIADDLRVKMAGL